jgi:RNA ligase (TIGR02306 family)
MTARKLASVRKIDLIVPHKNADRLEVAILGGWPVVVRKGEFQAGDLVVFCEVDCLLPPRPQYDFLEKSCSHTEPDGTEWYRIRTVRLRGQLSQGIVLPLTILDYNNEELGEQGYREGDVVTDHLGIRKYEKPLPPQLSGVVRGKFPHFIPRTDEERVQNLHPSEYEGRWFYLSEKLDGSSCTVYRADGHVGVCSRNLELVENPDNTLWHTAKKSGALPAVRCYNRDVAIQGEVIGPGIQGNPYKLTHHEFRAFNVYVIRYQRYMSKREFERFCFLFQIPTVPHLGRVRCNGDMTSIIEGAEGKSKLNEQAEREGVVWVSDGDGERISFKAISNKFLLNGGE